MCTQRDPFQWFVDKYGKELYSAASLHYLYGRFTPRYEEKVKNDLLDNLTR
jgi:hypothetical protein